MPKCPKCGKDIDTLLLQGKQVQTFRVSLGEDGLVYLWIDASDGLEDEEYACPECGETLFTNDIDATDFLMGKKGKSEVS
jgi:ribosomal protein S27AE